MSVRDVIEANRDLYVGWLVEACSIPSLDGDPEALAQMANWVEDKLKMLGAEVERLIVDDAPEALLARLGTGDRTLLIYDHYDVQPVDPIDLWDTDPFKPEIIKGKLFARGAADNKGDLVARLAGMHAWREVNGEFPCSIKFLVEGEEETGSKSFEDITTKYANELQADGCIWEGAGIDHAGRPEFVFGAKGLTYVELNHRGLSGDQHSSLAVVAPSPVWRMLEALATLRSPDGKVLIDGFYDDVVGPSAQDEELLRKLPFGEEEERERMGLASFIGDSTGQDLKRRYYFEPSCNIAGIISGFTQPNTSKTVLPAEIMVKIDMRLVPDQDPDDIYEKLRAHLDKRGFKDIELKHYSMEHPVLSPSDSLVARASLAAAEGIFEGEPAVAPLMIGTGPMWPIAHKLGIPTVSTAGVHRPDSMIHAPNENCRIEDFLNIAEYTAAYLKTFSELDA